MTTLKVERKTKALLDYVRFALDGWEEGIREGNLWDQSELLIHAAFEIMRNHHEGDEVAAAADCMVFLTRAYALTTGRAEVLQTMDLGDGRQGRRH